MNKKNEKKANEKRAWKIIFLILVVLLGMSLWTAWHLFKKNRQIFGECNNQKSVYSALVEVVKKDWYHIGKQNEEIKRLTELVSKLKLGKEIV